MAVTDVEVESFELLDEAPPLDVSLTIVPDSCSLCVCAAALDVLLPEAGFSNEDAVDIWSPADDTATEVLRGTIAVDDASDNEDAALPARRRMSRPLLAFVDGANPATTRWKTRTTHVDLMPAELKAITQNRREIRLPCEKSQVPRTRLPHRLLQ